MSQKQDYSPIKLPSSPGLNYVGNLTGHPRKIKDSAADCFNWYLRWKQLNIDGMAVLSKVSSILMKRSPTDKEHEGYSTELEELSKMLQNVVKELEEIVEKMSLICEQSRAMADLVKLEGRQTEPMFLSWPPERFYETYLLFKTSLEKELKMRKKICESVCHASSRDSLVSLVASWKHVPYLHPNFESRMDALLMETGHRPY